MVAFEINFSLWGQLVNSHDLHFITFIILIKKATSDSRWHLGSTGGFPYPWIQYRWFQLSAVYRGPKTNKKNWKTKEMNSS